MSNAPRLAVVVTNYNYAPYVTAAVDSALAQDDVEVIVVDDGSTDDSLLVLHSYADRVCLVAQSNRGQGGAFNSGFAHVTAPITVFLDADDVLAAGMTQRLERAFADPAVAKVQFPLGLIDGNGAALPGSMPPDPSRLSRGDVRARLLVGPDDLAWQPTSGNAFRTSVLRQMLPMPAEPYRICADYYLSNLASAHGSVIVLDRPGGSYRVHGANNEFSVVTSLAKLRENVVRTRVTNQLLLQHCRDIGVQGGPVDPAELRSVTALANRLVSLRLDPAGHPIAGDTRGSLVRVAVVAALRRSDLKPLRRLAAASWFCVLAAVPRRWVARVASPFVRVSVD